MQSRMESRSALVRATLLAAASHSCSAPTGSMASLATTLDPPSTGGHGGTRGSARRHGLGRRGARSACCAEGAHAPASSLTVCRARRRAAGAQVLQGRVAAAPPLPVLRARRG
eukprot:scaffold3392_cov278-Prasinococcus_capsulatus_cf.AAC.3